jgi:DinB family protein
MSDLQHYRDEIAALQQDARTLAGKLSDVQFNWRPKPARWSIGQCLAHLNLTNLLSFPEIESKIEEGRASNLVAPGPFKLGLRERIVIRLTEPPVRVGVSAPKQFKPPPNQVKVTTLTEFMALHDRLAAITRKAEGLDLQRIRVPTPIGGLKLSLGGRIALLIAHDRRHLWQAWRIRNHKQFGVLKAASS